MLGRLAKWLRLLGFDTCYADQLSDHQIAARARAEGRVVLTRDREMARRKGIRCLFINSQILEEQLEQVVAALGLPSPEAAPRCPQCNGQLAEVSRSEVRPHVSAYVWRTHHQFHHCQGCDKYYWPGSHWNRIQSTIAQVVGMRECDQAEVGCRKDSSGP